MRETLRNARKEKGLTQQTVADLLMKQGVSYENGFAWSVSWRNRKV